MSIENQEYFLNQWRIQKSMNLSVNAGEWKYGMETKKKVLQRTYHSLICPLELLLSSNQMRT